MSQRQNIFRGRRQAGASAALRVRRAALLRHSPTSPDRHPIPQLARSFSVGILLGLPSLSVLAAPTGGEVSHGQGSISQSKRLTTVRQDSNKLIVNWDSFDISAQERVNFLQPSRKATVLNRIFDQNPSQIHGSIRAQGRVLLVNPSGIIFSPTAHIQVQSLVASGLSISDADFLSDRYRFGLGTRDGEGGLVVNKGFLQAHDGGDVSLLGGAVRNEGVIMARMGQVTLAAGRAITMDFDGDGLLQFKLDESILSNVHDQDAAVDNSGTIQAEAGTVLLTGKAARQVFSNVVNNSGVVTADSVQKDGGSIRLVAGHADNSVLNTGRLDVSSEQGRGGTIQINAGGKLVVSGDASLEARSRDAKGGVVQLTGERVGLFDTTEVDVSGGQGGGEIAVGGGLMGKDPALRNSRLSLVAEGVRLRADATKQGDGGRVIVWSDGSTRYRGSISARGHGDGDGGFAEVSGKAWLEFLGIAELSGGIQGAKGQLLLDPDSIDIVDSAPDIDGAGPGTGQDLMNAGDLDAVTDQQGRASKITAGAVESLLQKAALSLVAANRITIGTPIIVPDAKGVLTLSATGGMGVIFDANVRLDGSQSGLIVIGSARINTSSIVTGGDQEYRGRTFIGASTSLQAKTVQFLGVLDGGNEALKIVGNMETRAAMTNLSSLTVLGTSDLGADVTTTGVQRYMGAVTLDADVVLTGSDGQFSDGVEGADNDLTLNFSADMTLGGSGGIRLTDIDVLTIGGGGKTIIGGDITTAGEQLYMDVVELTADVTLAGSGVQFGSTVAGGGNALTITGNLDLDGAATSLSSLSVSGTSTLSAGVTTTGGQSYTGVVTLDTDAVLTGQSGNFRGGIVGGGNDLTLNFSADMTLGGSGGIRLTGIGVLTTGGGGKTIIGGDITTAGEQSYMDAVELTADVVLSASEVQFGSTVSGGSNALTITGNLDLDGAVTGLSLFSVSGTSALGAGVTTIGMQTYTGAVTLDADVVLGASEVRFGSTVSGANQSLTIMGNLDLDGEAAGLSSLSVSGASDLAADVTTAKGQSYSVVQLSVDVVLTGSMVKFSNEVSGGSKSLTIMGNLDLDGEVAGLSSLSVSGASDLGADVTTTGVQTYTDVVSLDADVVLTGSEVQFRSTVSGGSKSLTITGDLDLDGAATGMSSLSVSGASDLGADVTTTTGNQIYTGAVTLDADVDLMSISVRFGSTVAGGGQSLTITGNLDLDGAVMGLSSLSVTGLSDLAADVTTTGDQVYMGAVNLNGNVVLTAGNGGTLRTAQFRSTVSGSDNSLTIMGNLDLDGEMNGMFSLSVSGTSALGGSVTTSRGQTYTGEVRLDSPGSGVTLMAGAGGTLETVWFGSTVVGGSKSLTITGDLDLDGEATGLSSLSVSGASTLGAGVTTTGAQVYTGVVSLDSGVTLTGQSGSFAGGVDGGGNDLVLNFSADTTLGGSGILLMNIGALTTGGGGKTIIGGAITTTGRQWYMDAVELAGGIVLGASEVRFGGTVSGGGQSLTITGDLDLDSEATGLSVLSVSGASTLGAGVTTTGVQTYTGVVSLDAGVTLTGQSGSFTGGVDGGGNDLVLNFSADTTLGGSGIRLMNIGALTTGGGGKTIIGGAITTTGRQWYMDAVELAGGIVLSASEVRFGSTVSGGGQSLTITGDLDLDGEATGLSSLSVSGASTLGAGVTTTGVQGYTGAVSLDADVVLSASEVQFVGGVLGGGQSLTITGDLDLDGAAMGLSSLSVSSASTLGAGVTTTGVQAYTGAVSLDSGVTLTGQSGSFAGGVDGGGNDLVLNFSADTTLGGSGIRLMNIGALTTGGGGKTIIGGAITTTGRQWYMDAVELAGGIVLGASEVRFGSTVSGGGQSLTITGDLDLDGAAMGLSSLSVSGASTLGAGVTTTGVQGYTGAVSLDADVVLSASEVQFVGGVLGGGQSLTITGDLDLDGEVAGLSSLSVSGASTLGAGVTTTGVQTYTGAVSLDAGVTLTGQSGSFAGGVDGGGNDLVLNFSADTTLGGSGIRLMNIGALTTGGGGKTIIGGAITTTGRQWYMDAVELAGGIVLSASEVRFGGTVSGGGQSLTITGDLDLDGEAVGLSSLSVSGASTLGAGVTTTGVQGYTGVVSLDADVVLSASEVQFGSTVSGGGQSLTITGDLDLDGAAMGLSSLSVSGASTLGAGVTTTGVQGYTGAVSLDADVVLSASEVQFGSTVSGGSNALTITGDLDLDGEAAGLSVLSVSGASTLGAGVTTTGVQTYTGAVSLDADVVLSASEVQFGSTVSGDSNALTITGDLDLDGEAAGLSLLSVSGASDLGAGVTTTGVQTYTGVVRLSAGVTLTGQSGSFTGGIDGGGNDLVLNFSADTTLGGSGSVKFTNIGILTTGGGGRTIIGGDITTTGRQWYMDAVELTEGVVLTASEVRFGSTLSGGGQSLTITGDLDLDGAATGLSLLSVSGASDLGADVTTTGVQAYTGAMSLDADVVLTASEVRFGSTLSGGGNALRITGDLDLDGAATGLSLLSVSGASDLGADVTTTGVQTYTGAVTLSAGVTLTGQSGSFTGGIDGGGNDLTLNFSADTTLGGGGSVKFTNIGILTTGGGGKTIIGGDITTIGRQWYMDAVELTGGVVLSASEVRFGGTVSGGGQSLTITGDLDLDGAAMGLSSLSVSGASTLGAGVTTTGVQTYTGAVSLDAGVTLTGQSGSFAGGVDGGGNDLVLNFSADTTLGGSGIRLMNIGALTTGGGGKTIIGGAITTTGRQWYMDAVELAGGIVLGASEVRFGSTVSGGSNTLTIMGDLDLDGEAVGLSSLSVSGASTLGAGVTTTGVQAYTGAVSLGTDVVLSASEVQFVGGVLGGGQSLMITGDLDLDGAAAGLSSLSVSGASTLGARVTTTGVQTYTGAVSLDADVVLSASEVQFGSTVSGDSNALTITGDLDLDGEAAGLSLLSVSGASTLGASVTTTGVQTYTGAVSLDSDVVLSASEVRFGSTVSGGSNALTITGDLDLDGEVTGLSSLSVSGASTLGAGVTTTGVQGYTGAVSLDADVVLSASEVQFVGGVLGGGQSLTITGDLDLDGEAEGLSSLSVSGASTLGAGVTTTGVQGYTGVVSLDAGVTLTGQSGSFAGGVDGGGNDLVLNFSADTTLGGSGIRLMNIGALTTGGGGKTIIGGAITTTGRQWYMDAVELAGGIVLGASEVRFGGTVSGGGQSLTITGDLDLDGEATGLSSLSVSGASTLGAGVTTTGVQGYTGVVSLDADVVLSASEVQFGSTVSGGGQSLTITGDLDLDGAAMGLSSLSVSGASTLGAGVTTTGMQGYTGAVSLDADVVLSASEVQFGSTVSGGSNALTITGDLDLDGEAAGLSVLSVSGASTLGAGVTTTGVQTYTGAVSLDADVVLSASEVQFGSTVSGDSNALTITGDLDLDGEAAGLSLLSVSGASDLGAGVTTTGVQTYTGVVRLSAGVTLTGQSGSFTGGIDGGGNDLVLNFSADTTLGGSGSVKFTNIGILTTGGGGRTIIGGDITTTGRQWYMDAVELTEGVVLTASEVRFGSTLSGGGQSLTITGDLDLDGAATGLSLLSVSGASDLGADVTTTGVQAYTGAMSLDADVVLTASEVRFGSTLSGGGNALRITGDLDLDGAATGLSLLSVSGASDLGADVTTTGVQTYTGAVTLSAGVTLTGQSGSFTGGIDGGGNDLTLNFSADTTLGGGGSVKFTNIGILTTGGGGKTIIGGDITTIGRQWYMDAVELTGGVVLSASEVRFGSTLSGGGQSLTITGDLDLDGEAMGLSSLSVSGASTLGAGVTTTGVQTYTGAVSLDSDVVLSASEVRFGSTLAGGGNALTITGDLDLDGAATGLSLLSVSGASALGAGVTTTGLQTYTGAVSLDADVVLSASEVRFRSMLSGGGRSLRITGDLDLDGAATGLSLLSVSGASDLGADVTTTGMQIYTGAVSLDSDVVLSASEVQFRSTLSGGGNALRITGDLDLDGAATGLSLLSVSGASALGADVTTTGMQAYTGAVSLDADVVLSASEVQFGSTLSGGGRSLRITGDLDLDGAATGLSLLSVSGASALGADVTTTGVQTYTGAVSLDADVVLSASEVQFGSTLAGGGNALTITGDLDLDGEAAGLSALLVSGVSTLGAGVTTTGMQTYTGVVSLDAGVVLRASEVQFVGGVSGGGQSLTIMGDLDLDGEAKGLSVLSVSGASTLGADVTTTGDQVYTGVATLNADVVLTGSEVQFVGGVSGGGQSLRITGDLDLDGAAMGLSALSVSGVSDLGADVTTTGVQAYTGVVSLDADVVLSASEVRFVGGVLGGGRSLTITGDLDLDGEATGLSALSVSGVSDLGADVTTTGMQTYTGVVSLDANVALSASEVRFGSTLAGGGNALTITGDLDLDGEATGLSSLSVSGASVLGADVTTTGVQTYTGAVSLDADVVLTGSEVQFVGGVSGGGQSLRITGDLDLDGEATGLSALLVSGASALGADVTTARDQVYTGVVTLDVDVVLSASEVQFVQGVSGGGNALTVTGDLDLDGEATGLSALSVSGMSVLGADVRTTGQQTYTDAVSLDADVVLTASEVRFGSTLAGEGQSLTVTGDLDLDGEATGLSALSVSGISALGANVTTTGNQTYAGRVRLTADVTLSGAIPSFGAGVSGGVAPGAVGENYDLTLSFSGITRLDETFTDIDNLLVNGGGEVQISMAPGTALITIGEQRYDDMVRLASGVVLRPGTAHRVHFGSTVDSMVGGAQDLEVDGSLRIEGAVGSNARLNTLKVTGDSELVADVYTVNEQDYTGDVSVTGAITLSALEGSGSGSDGDTRSTVTFEGAVDGGSGAPARLDLDADLVLAIGGVIGSTSPLESLSVRGQAALGGSITTVALQEYADTVQVDADITLTSMTVRFASTVDGRPGVSGADIEDLSAEDGLSRILDETNPHSYFDALLANTGNGLVLRATELMFADDVSARALDMSDSSNLTVAGDVTLHVDPANLQLPSSVDGTETSSLTVAAVRGEDLLLGEGGLLLSDFSGFLGHLIFGGRLQVEGVEPYYKVVPDGPDDDQVLEQLVVNTAALTLAQEFISGGTITFLAGDIFFRDPVEITVGRQLGFFAGSDVFVPGTTGIIDATGVADAVTLKASNLGPDVPAVTFVAGDRLVDSRKIFLSVSRGEVDVATGSGFALQFNIRSDSRDTGTSELFDAFLNEFLDPRGLQVDTSQTFSVNPAVSLVGVTTAFLDLGLFEEELTLYGQIGTGIALSLSQCEEQEDCAPSVTEEELVAIIDDLQQRIRVLEEELAGIADDRNRSRIEGLMVGYRDELENFIRYQQSLAAFIAAAEEDDFNESELLDENLSPGQRLRRDREVRSVADVLATISVREQWLESLKEDSETRKRLGSTLGIDLTPVLLDRLIEATRKELEFFENRLRQILGGERTSAARARFPSNALSGNQELSEVDQGLSRQTVRHTVHVSHHDYAVIRQAGVPLDACASCGPSIQTAPPFVAWMGNPERTNSCVSYGPLLDPRMGFECG